MCKSAFFFAFIIAAVLGMSLFTTCSNESPPEQGQEAAIVLSDSLYLERGRTIAGATFATLSGRLQEAMKAGGVRSAVEVCNLAAMPLVDSLSEVYQAQIRRTTLQPRNPENAPTAEEREILESYQSGYAAGARIGPLTKEISPDQVAFYAPIHTVELCLKCHGKVGETMQEGDYTVIKALYPKDQAIGYESADFRGMWSITMRK